MKFLLLPLQLILVSAISFGSASSAWAWPPTFGSEFNFTNLEMSQAWFTRKLHSDGKDESWQNPAEAEQAVAAKFADQVRERCGKDCVVTPHPGKFGATEYQVKFKDGFGFNISVDPGCIEIQTEPETLARLHQFEPRTQQFIFSLAKDLGLSGEKQSAHFNVGIVSAFDRDPKGFLKFFVNYHNLPHLASGALGESFPNAPPISHLKPEQRAALAKIVDDVNHGKIKTAQEVAVRIQKEVYTWTPTFDVGFHYQGISVKHVREDTKAWSDKPFEFRAPRQPQSAHERTLLAELMEKRMEFDHADTNPIVFLDVPEQRFYHPSEMANRFRLYLADMGADWDHFKALLPEGIRDQAPDAFMSGKVDGKSYKDVELLKSYTPYLASSPWARQQMASILLSPEAVQGGKVGWVLKAAEASLGPHANPQARERVEKFVTAVKNGQTPEESRPRVAHARTGIAQCVLTKLSSRFGRSASSLSR